MARFKIDEKRTALIIIDMTNDFLKEGAVLEVPRAREIIPRLKELIELCRNRGIPIVYTSHIHHPDGRDMGIMQEIWSVHRDRKACLSGTPGPDIWADIKPMGADIVVYKHRYDAFYNTDLEIMLRGLKVDTLIFAGTVTNLCCDSTARSAMFRDFRVIFLSDLNAAEDIPAYNGGVIPASDVQRVVLSTIALGFGEVISSKELIDRLGSLRSDS